MKSPVLTRRLEKVPSTGARTEVKSRSRSALASEVCNSASWARASACCAFVTSTLSRAASSGRLRRFHRRDALIAAGFGNLKGRARGKIPWCSAPAGARSRGRPRFKRGFRGSELRLGLLDGAFRAR